MQEIKIQEEEMARMEKELHAKVRQPAEAEKYRMERIAEAEKNRVVLEGWFKTLFHSCFHGLSVI